MMHTHIDLFADVGFVQVIQTCSDALTSSVDNPLVGSNYSWILYQQFSQILTLTSKVITHKQSLLSSP